MDATGAIISWASKLPPWLAEAVRRHLASNAGELNRADFADVLTLARIEFKLSQDPPPAPHEFPSREQQPNDTQSDTSPKMTLDSISAVSGVNALQSGTALSFAPKGVTLIYGNNGAGKSGYTRILKQACTARDKDEQILPNVYASDATAKPAATIHWTFLGQSESIAWQDGGDTTKTPLPNVIVFDARCAHVIIDERNDVIFMPTGVEVFERLAHTARRVREALASEIISPQRILDSGIIQGSPTATFLANLSSDTIDSDIQLHTNWADLHTARLKDFEALVSASAQESITAELGKCEQAKQSILYFRSLVEKQVHSIESLTSEIVQKAHDRVIAAVKAHQIAVSNQNTDSLLAGSGTTSEWRVLYDAAQAFSIHHAYPGHEFPVTEGGAICVLCQQELSQAAITRFGLFKNFVQDATAQEERSSRQEWGALRTRASQVALPHAMTISATCNVADAFTPDKSTSTAIKNCEETLGNRLASVSAWLNVEPTEGRVADWSPLDGSPLPLLDAAIEAIEARKNQLLGASKPEEHASLIRRRDALRSRKALHAHQSEVIAHVNVLRRNQLLQRAVANISTLEITRQGKLTVGALVTPALMSGLQAELKQLGAAHIKLGLKSIGDVGETVHEMSIAGSSPLAKKMRPSQIFSEGEQRVVALAGFFSELALSKQGHPIVLDDPASSLDQRYTRQIAVRIARESLERQVVVFSHNLAFLMELREAVDTLAKQGSPTELSLRAMNRAGEKAGVISLSVPWPAQRTAERVDALRKFLGKFKQLHEQDQAQYNEKAAQLYALLREAWEGCVEEDLFGTVVTRYRNSVQTLRLVQIRVEDVDVWTIEVNMSKCSAWMRGHDKSKALSDDRPSPEEIASDLDALQEFSTLLSKRRKATESERKKKLTSAQTS